MGNCYSYFRFENELIIATGKGEPAWVMSENVLSLDEHASYFENIDPVSQYKRWTTRQISNRNSHSLPVYNISSEGVKGAFVVSDPVDWGRVIQAAFPTERLGMGAFRIALESVFNRNPEAILSQFLPSYVDDNGDAGSHSFRTLYMIGDNPMVDVKGRTSLVFYLDETGVFKGVDNHAEFPADLVVDTVEEAVEYILPRELIS
ncbi:Hydrolase family protein / HAD-superfamily protein [Citrus sinensis]|nr:Hydrolase family protein / HAD-superfamily protein [Citrus sinensis]